MSAAARARPPRVLALVDWLGDDCGGAERFAAGLAAAIDPRRYEVEVCVTRTAGGELPASLRAAGVNVHVLGRSGRFDVWSFRRLAGLLRAGRVQVLHAHKFGSNVWGTLLGSACRVPVIVAQEHSWSYEGQPLRRFLDGRVIARMANRFVAVSEADRNRMISVEGVPAGKALTIPTAFVPRESAGEPGPRSDLRIPAGATVVGTVAGLRPVKALEVLIEAFGLVAAERDDVHLMIVGDGPARADLERVAAAGASADRVHFAGNRTDLDAVLADIDIAAMSSVSEGLPLFVFECMAHDVPLVATDVGGLRDVVTDGETGLLVAPGAPGELAGALRGLLADPARARALAAAARERLPEYTMDRIATRFADLYDELLAESER